jgi:hypothetical protein
MEMMAAISDNFRKHTKTIGGVNSQSVKVKANGTNSYRYALKHLLIFEYLL